jgi:hypothetical protein
MIKSRKDEMVGNVARKGEKKDIGGKARRKETSRKTKT